MSDITPEEFAAMEFEAVPEFVFVDGYPSPTVAENNKNILKNLGISTRWAIALLGKSKAELIKQTREAVKGDKGGMLDDLLEQFENSIRDAKTIVEMLETTEKRLLCALANNASSVVVRPGSRSSVDFD
jgi:hypothetical protein